jgi:nucleoside-diphosphate-sugar epimerase
MTRVVVTGARGFVGGAVVRALSTRAEVIAASRTPTPVAGATRTIALTADHAIDDMARALTGVDAVIHAAALVHDVRGTTSDADYDRVNRAWVADLGAACVRAGVPRLVFVSTIKVNGDVATRDHPFTATSTPAPDGAYAAAKWAAERALAELPLAVSIIRPPLVYGPGVGANFASLVRLVGRGLPLPLGHVRNARSLVFVDNLADAIARAALDRAAPRRARTFLVADDEAPSTPELVRAIAHALGKRVRLFPAPGLALALRAVGRGGVAQRLLGSLVVDSTAIRAALGWTPPHTLAHGLAATVHHLAPR